MSLQTDIEPARELAKAPLKVSFFGRPSDVFGKTTIVDIPSEGLTLGALRQLLEEIRGPEAAGALGSHVRAIVNDEITGADLHVKPGQDIAFISAVSGG